MAVTDQNRRDLYNKLEHELGAEPADTLMQLLPLRPADELLTISYFHAEMATQRAELRSEIADLRTELRGEMGELRGEMGELRSELRGEMGELRTELKLEMSELRTELRGDMSELRNEFVDRFTQSETKMVRWLVSSAAANIITVITALSI